MNKHVLMLTAATVALMAGPAFAAGPTPITSKETSQYKTSASGDITIGDSATPTDGSVVVTVAGPAIEIDSANSVKIATSGSTVSNLNTTGAIGIQLDGSTGAGYGPSTAGALAVDNSGTIDLTGSGNGKTGILLTNPDTTGDIFNGGITLETGSTLKVAGDNSYGIHTQSGTTLNGTITILGSLLVSPTTVTSTSGGSVTAMQLDGNINGDVTIGTGGILQATGFSAKGVVINGDIAGAFQNKGSLTATGAATPSTTTTNPEAGTALTIAGSVIDTGTGYGGLLNAGPSITDTSIVAATISEGGPGNAVSISAPSSSSGITFGTVNDSTNPGYSFLNRGSITAKPLDNNYSASAVSIVGGTGAPVTFNGGIYNSGTISATSTGDVKGSTYYNATALSIDYTSVGTATCNGMTVAFCNTTTTGLGAGTISASVSGALGGNAKAIYIGAQANIASLYNDGTISASATSTDTTITNPLTAYAIIDQSGTLTKITNAGTISATATTLDSGNQVTVALGLSKAQSAVTIDNSGTITGDVNLGAFDDTVNVTGPAGGSAATITGNIAFGGGNNDTLNIGTGAGSGTVTGKVTETGSGRVAVNIGGGGSGTLTLQNTSTALVASNLTVNDGGTLNLSLSNGLNQQANATNPAVVIANNVSFSQLSVLKVSFGSFISTSNNTATFTLFDASGGITINNQDVIKNSVSIPYLYQGSLCTYNFSVSGIAGCSSGSGTDQKLVLTLQPKTAGQLGLTGSAATIYDYANAALANDDTLGGAMVSDITDKASAQAAYAAFVPDLSGSTRAVAISLTDQATGMVWARQRALRMYAGKEGGTTMWGQEFVQRLTSGNDANGFRASGFGFALGADGGSPRSGRYGGAFTFFSGDQTNKGQNFQKTTNQWYMLTGYTDWRGKGLFLDTQLSFGFGKLDGKRTITLTDSSGNTTLKRTAEGKRNGLLGAAGFSTGAIFTYGSLVLTPQISIDALTMREEGYTETGGGDGLDLKVRPYYANSVRGYIGGNVRRDIDFDGFYVQPELRAGYRYDFLADPVKLKAAFASVGNNFTLTGPDPERGNLIGGASLAVTTGAWSLGINYDYVRGSKGGIDQTGTLTLVGRI